MFLFWAMNWGRTCLSGAGAFLLMFVCKSCCLDISMWEVSDLGTVQLLRISKHFNSRQTQSFGVPTCVPSHVPRIVRRRPSKSEKSVYHSIMNMKPITLFLLSLVLGGNLSIKIHWDDEVLMEELLVAVEKQNVVIQELMRRLDSFQDVVDSVQVRSGHLSFVNQFDSLNVRCNRISCY